MIGRNNLIVWNCRRAARKYFFRFSKYYIDMYKLEVFAIMETRCDPVKLQVPLQKLGFHKLFLVENVGYAGGIMVACKEDNLKVELLSSMDRAIHLLITNNSGQKWCFTVVYASPNEIMRKHLWENMKLVSDNMVMPWLATSDLNYNAMPWPDCFNWQM